MKKEYYLIIIIIILTIIYLLVPVTKEKEIKDVSNKEEKRAVFISYIELGNYLRGKDEKEMKKVIDEVIDTSKNFGFNMLILQVRAFSDAIYYSNIFPSSRTVVNKEGDSLPFDILKYFINKAHKNNLEVHAWINPYRISNTIDTTKISKDNPANKYLNTSNAIIIEGKGIYYNPASKEVSNLILEGIKELITNYDVDGIHFDDYFYPDSETIDQKEYQEALKNNKDLSLRDFRLSITTSLIKDTYDLIKSYDKNILFGISPDGNIDNNYNSNYIDTKLFATSKGYVDYLMPQVYYGFLNSVKPFDATVKSWNNLITNDISLIPALAFYKTGNEDTYAKEGSDEWLTYNNIIANEVLLSRTLSNYQGFAIFRYDSIFGNNISATSFLEKENLKSIL